MVLGTSRRALRVMGISRMVLSSSRRVLGASRRVLSASRMVLGTSRRVLKIIGASRRELDT